MRRSTLFSVVWITGMVLGAGCSNVIPPEVEKKIESEEAERRAAIRSVRELWVLETNKGSLMFRLFPKDAPASVAQVRAWTEAGVYDGTWFHRVVRSPRPFVIQGGDPDSAALQPVTTESKRLAQAERLGFGTTAPALPPETTRRKHTAGALALAVSEDGRRAGPQFVISLAELPHLDETQPVFGHLVGGWSVLERIEVGDRVRRARLLPPERIPGEWIRDLPRP